MHVELNLYIHIFSQIKFSQFIPDCEKKQKLPPPIKIPNIWYVALIISLLHEGSPLKSMYIWLHFFSVRQEVAKFLYILI